MITLQEVREAVAQGWCTPKNCMKPMDFALAEAISEKIIVLLNDKLPAIEQQAILRKLEDGTLDI